MCYYYSIMLDVEKPTHPDTELFECFRCGICCTKFQAIVRFDEMQKIATYLGISVDEWVKQYSDPKWFSYRNFLIKHVDSACVFLRYENDLSTCTIYPARPACCSDWIASEEQKECQEGLKKLANLKEQQTG
jgi:Fe-S-cluster containining protein